MKEIPFYKMVASGNDFVVIDNRRKVVADGVRLSQALCSRHEGVGADGVLLVEDGPKADYRIRIFNADGSEAEACGNGFRCAALLAHERFGFAKKQRFESLSGVIDAEVKGSRIRVRLADPGDLRGREKLQISGRDLHYDYVNTGVPHTVIFVEGLAQIPVSEIGREIRFHSEFKPAGTNVNFVEVTGPQSIAIRTYERGVEEETLACGTGVSASAIVSSRRGYTKPPVQVKTRGGEVLTVDFSRKGTEIRDVYLEGEARLVFEGKWVIQ